MKLYSVWQEVASMMYWTMLAACTVGPGTVVTCARAGAEYDLSLIWALVFASTLAFTLQEGTVRLTITSGFSLGQCLRHRAPLSLVRTSQILSSHWFLRHYSTMCFNWFLIY